MMIEPNANLDKLANKVIGAAIELTERGIAFERQKPVKLRYKNHVVGDAKLDLLIDQQLIVELKAVDALHPIHHAQIINYLKATGFQLGLLMNFNVVQLKSGIKRIVLT